MEDFQYQQIIKFLQGELNADEGKAFTIWRNANTENEKYFQEVQFLWQKTKQSKVFAEAISIDVDAALQNVHSQLPQPIDAKVIQLNRMRKIAAAAAAVVLLAGLFWMLNTPPVQMLVVQTADNEQKRVLLPDESIVWLNENSKLIYPESFGNQTREISMNGDLFFEVMHNKQQPFVVKSNELAVQVLGTKFNVRSIDNSKSASLVHVINGKVKVQRDDLSGNQVMLEKGMSAILNHKDSLFLTDDFSANRLFWFNQTLEFEEVSLADVFKDLEHIFDVKLSVENPKILNCVFSGKFDKDITVEKILEMMTAIFNISFEKINSNHYTIKNGAC